MYETATATALDLVATYGVAVLLVVFLLEGALVGKLIPTRTLFLAAVVAAGSDVFAYATVFGAAVLGATLGQCALFLATRKFDVDPAEIDLVPIDESRLDRADQWLTRWGLPAVALSNVVPLARGSLTVPTALSDVPSYKFSAYSMAGSATYAGALLGIGIGLDTAIGTVV